MAQSSDSGYHAPFPDPWMMCRQEVTADEQETLPEAICWRPEDAAWEHLEDQGDGASHGHTTAPPDWAVRPMTCIARRLGGIEKGFTKGHLLEA